jgi:hypothetical protein
VPDPFDTAALRAAVLASWAGSPTRFREDANAEEDLRLGGYADAWLVELAQNAADAARAAGVPGRLVVRVVDGELRVANTGAPLDAAGVAALASLRASAKRDSVESVGRFGVGFAAVLALSDEPRIVSADGGVAFSATRTAEEVAALPGPAGELAGREGQLPVLRLAWPVAADEPPVPAGATTEVRLPLRPGVDPAALLAHTRAAASDLLLALPELVEVAVDGTALRREDGPAGQVRIGGRRWLLARRGGAFDAADTAALGVEQRGRLGWTVCWALPLAVDGTPDPLEDEDVLHAPTATAERLALPARLVAAVPVEPDRRRVRPGPATDRVLAAAAAAYVDLVRAVAPAHRVALVPAAGFPRSEPDGRLRELVLDQLRAAAWLPGADGGELAPSQAQELDVPNAEGLAELLVGSGSFPGLLAPVAPVPRELGVRRLGAAEMTERLLEVRRAPSWWRAVYAALEPAADTVPGLRDELRGLPVPLGDGRVVSGPASVLLPAGGCAAVARVAALGLPGLYVAHADAVHPLLARLGARPAEPAALLAHPALRAAVERSMEDAEAGLDTAPLAAAVLGLVTEVGSIDAAGLAALALPADDGRPARADELMLPDAALRPVLAADAPVGVLDAGWAARYPRSTLTAVGVLDGFAVLVDEDPAGPDHDLDAEERWWDGLDAPPARLVAVRDLDLVADAAWPAALALLAGEPTTRAVVTAPGAYAGWWLARYARLGGRRPGHWRLRSAARLAALYDPPPDLSGVDEEFLRAVGVRADLEVADAGTAADLLARLADPARNPDQALAAAAHAALAAAVTTGRVDPDDVPPPRRARALDGTVADAEVAVVLDLPWLAPVLPARELVGGGTGAAATALADLLDLPLASEVVAAEVEGDGEPVRWVAVPEVVLACGALGIPVPAGELRHHDELTVVVHRPTGGRRSVPAWCDDQGRWHASDPLRALLGLVARGSG